MRPETSDANGIVGPTSIEALEARECDGVGARYDIAGALGGCNRCGRRVLVGPVATGRRGTP